jgi:hypothetical protein
MPKDSMYNNSSLGKSNKKSNNLERHIHILTVLKLFQLKKRKTKKINVQIIRRLQIIRDVNYRLLWEEV